MDNIIKQIEETKEKIQDAIKLLDIVEMRKKYEELKKEMNEEGFWDARESAVEVSREAEEINKEINTWTDLEKEVDEILEFAQESGSEGDDSMEKEIEKKHKEINKKFEKLEFYILFNGEYDKNNAILSIHAGTGGVDAQDWAEILERMFLRLAEKKSYKTEIIDRNLGNEAGIKSVTISIEGRYSYGNLKSESGVHRLVRISPFDAEAMRHTSFALVEVIPELPETVDVVVREEDLKIDVFRSSGPGGQSVNTTDSAVRIKHIPTNIIVSCQNERSQHQNKDMALKILKSKIFKLEEERRQKEENKLKGEVQKAEWGKQIRSYVMQPYKMVKDHRTEHETQEIDAVLDGDLDGFIEAYLKWQRNN